MSTTMPPTPCMPFDESREYKTIGLAACPDCGSHDCLLHYLRWEVRVGVKLNADLHHLVKKD